MFSVIIESEGSVYTHDFDTLSDAQEFARSLDFLSDDTVEIHDDSGFLTEVK